MAKKAAAKKTARRASKPKHKFIIVRKSKGICEIQLNRPDVLNALNLEMAQEIADEAAQGEVCSPANDNAPGQIVLSGAMSAIDPSGWPLR